MTQRYCNQFCHAVLTFLIALTSSTSFGGDASVPGREGLLDSTWPYGRSDSWRTSAVVGGAGRPKNFAPGALVATNSPVPFWGAAASPDLCSEAAYSEVGDDIFILGGSPFLMALFSFASPETIDFRHGEHFLDASLFDPDELVEAIAEAAAVDPYVVPAPTVPRNLRRRTWRQLLLGRRRPLQYGRHRFPRPDQWQHGRLATG
jgi:hypothetical protein